MREGDALSDAGPRSESAAPCDAEGWRARIAVIPTRDLFRLLQEDKVRVSRVLSGFRATPDSLRHPIVLSRLIEEAVKQPRFAQELSRWAPHAFPGVSLLPKERSEAAGAGQAPDPRLKEKLKDQRAALREKGKRIAALEGALAEAQRERDAARGDAEEARLAQKKAEAQADRLLRQRDREARRARDATPAPKGHAKAVSTTVAPPAPADFSPWEEALRRLASRGKHEMVAEVCREALASGGEGIAALYALYAEALQSQGHPLRAAEQERRAVDAYLNAGDVASAAASFTRTLPYATKSRDVALLRRLLILARRTGQEETVRSTFGRLRGTATEAYRCLCETIAAFGGQFTTFLAAPRSPTIGPDETISLPTGGIADVTPRRLAAAVDANDAAFVARAREGIAALRDADPPLTDALLKAVAAENPAAMVPLTQPTRPIIVDASNVARHDPDPLVLSPLPRVALLMRMRDFLLGRGYFPVLMLADANLRFYVDDRSAFLALIERGIIRETPPGTAADVALIAEAKERGAPLVTNDRLWDWEEARDIERLGFGFFFDDVSFTAF